METKLVTEWERQTGIVITSADSSVLQSAMTEDEFIAYLHAPTTIFVGVNYDSRIKFLRDNDYEVTRDTLIDTKLSVKPQA